MTNLLYYPNSPLSLNDIAENICQRPDDKEGLAQSIAKVNYCESTDNLSPTHQGIIIPGSNSSACIQKPILTPEESRHLSFMAAAMGGTRVMAMADLLSQTKVLDHIGNAGTFTGGASMGAVKTSDYVLNAIRQYDDALSHYEALKNHSAAPATLQREAPKVKKAFDQMNHALNQKGMNQLEKHAFKTRQVKNLNGRIVTESIPVSNNAEVQALKRFAQKARYAGKGLVVLDAGLRVNSVYQHYQTGKDWKREAVVQTAGFAAGISVATAFITMVSVATPLGLVLAIAVSGAAAFGVDWGAKTVSGIAYDLF
jgi:hypothetical protein